MEILELQSSHSLTTRMLQARPPATHSYPLHGRQFITVQQSWQKHGAARGQALGGMTLGCERIWMTAAAVAAVAAAIRSTRSPLALG